MNGCPGCLPSNQLYSPQGFIDWVPTGYNDTFLAHRWTPTHACQRPDDLVFPGLSPREIYIVADLGAISEALTYLGGQQGHVYERGAYFLTRVCIKGF